VFNKESAHLNVVAIIQARMGSRRFPGKVLADLRGRPVLEWVVDAVKRVEGLHQIVVATTTNPEDQEIEDWCMRNGIQCFRGEPLDVLKRYADCARKYRATHVLRITADCPLLDSETVTTVLQRGLQAEADYFGLAGEFPDGFDCEGFTLQAILRANRDAHEAIDREHVTNYFKNHTENFDTLPVHLLSGYADLRLTVDQPEDLLFLNHLLEQFDVTPGPAQTAAVLNAAFSVSDKFRFNRDITRNSGFHLTDSVEP
jgi:spore coat polysaccharide biosynthesis protein SpsF